MWNFRHLDVWRRSRALVGTVFELTSTFPKEHRFGLATQMQRSANSIGANIAEASGRAPGADRARFLNYAIGSASETEHHVIVAFDAGLINKERAVALVREIDEVRRMAKALRTRTLEIEI